MNIAQKGVPVNRPMGNSFSAAQYKKGGSESACTQRGLERYYRQLLL